VTHDPGMWNGPEAQGEAGIHRCPAAASRRAHRAPPTSSLIEKLSAMIIQHRPAPDKPPVGSPGINRPHRQTIATPQTSNRVRTLLVAGLPRTSGELRVATLERGRTLGPYDISIPEQSHPQACRARGNMGLAFTATGCFLSHPALVRLASRAITAETTRRRFPSALAAVWPTRRSRGLWRPSGFLAPGLGASSTLHLRRYHRPAGRRCGIGGDFSPAGGWHSPEGGEHGPIALLPETWELSPSASSSRAAPLPAFTQGFQASRAPDQALGHPLEHSNRLESNPTGRAHGQSLSKAL